MRDDKIDLLVDLFKEHKQDTKEWMQMMEGRMAKTEEQLFMYKTIIKIVKVVGAALLLVLTLKFGDVFKLLGRTL